MEPRKRSVTQTAIHVPHGKGKSLWMLDQLMTFKVHDQSETVGIAEFEIPPERGAPPHLHRTQDETHYVLKDTSSSSSVPARSVLVPARWSTFPG
jgi:mannose-6-phosphate isomerase-like protein (cupin superfamily)